MTSHGGIIVPYSIESEEAVIGSILIDGECIEQVLDIIVPYDFYHEPTRATFEMMVDLFNHKEAINQITVAQRMIHYLDKKDASSGVSIAYLSSCIANVPTSLEVVEYANIVKRLSFYRKLLGVSSQMANIAMQSSPDMQSVMDRCIAMLAELQKSTSLGSRLLSFGIPKLIETNPPRYIWSINGKEMRLTLSEITMWGKFKNRIIAELNFVPIRPKDWDETINNLITHSQRLEAPADASEEQQLKILIQRWFDRMREVKIYSDLAVGRHLVKDVKGKNYYFFKSTPLLDYLRKEWKHGINSEDLWVSVHKWNGIKRKVRVTSNAPDGSTPVDLWGLPLSFVESADDKVEKQQELAPQQPDNTQNAPPDDF